MNCYDCYKDGEEQAAVGSCRNCSAGLCGRHVVEESQAVTTEMLINRVVELPLRARRLLCKTCADALAQPRARR
jgi:hypothetical protein